MTLIQTNDSGARAQLNRRLFWFLAALFLAGGVLSTALSRRMIYDEVSYYAYLSSIAIDGDLDLSNDYDLGRLGFVDWNHFAFTHTITGATDNKFSIGPAIIWTPFFLLAHLGVLLYNLLGGAVPADGYTVVYKTAVIYGSQIASIIALLLLFRLGDALFGRKASSYGVFALLLASFWCVYIFVSPLMSQSLSIAAAVVFVWAWHQYFQSETYSHAWILGLASAFLVLVRWQNLILVASAMLYVLIGSLLEESRAAKLRGIGKLAGWGLYALAGILPQSIVWYFQNGNFLVVPQGYDFLHWTHPQILPLLFSSWHGLFSSHPVLLLGLAGILLFGKERGHLLFVFLVSFVGMTYLNSIVDDWWAGASFGMRRYDSLLPFFGLGLMRVWQAARGPAIRLAVAITTGFLALVNILLGALYSDFITNPGFPLYQQTGVIGSYLARAWANPLDALPLFSPFRTLVSAVSGQPIDSRAAAGWIAFAGMLLAAAGLFLLIRGRARRNAARLAVRGNLAYLALTGFISIVLVAAGLRTDFDTLQKISLGKSVYLSGQLEAAREIYDSIAGTGICEAHELGLDLAVALRDYPLLNRVGSRLVEDCGPGGWLRLLGPGGGEVSTEIRARAAQQLEDYTRWHPNEAGILTTMARYDILAGGGGRAQTLLETAVRADPGDIGAVLELSALHQARGNLLLAVDGLSSARGYLGAFLDARLSEIYTWQGDEKNSGDRLRLAALNTSGDPVESMALAEAYYRSGDWTTFLRQCSHALSQSPEIALGSWYPDAGVTDGQAWMGISRIHSGEDKSADCSAGLEAYSYSVDSYQAFIELSLAANNLKLAENAHALFRDASAEQLQGDTAYFLVNWHLQVAVEALQNMLKAQRLATERRLREGNDLFYRGYETQAADILLPLTIYDHPRYGLAPSPSPARIRDLAEDGAYRRLAEIDRLLDELSRRSADMREKSAGFQAGRAYQRGQIAFLNRVISGYSSYVFWWTPRDITGAYVGQAEAFLCLDRPQDAYTALFLAKTRGQHDALLEAKIADLEQAMGIKNAGHALDLSSALRREPGNYPLWVQYGRTAARAGDRTRAEAAFQKAIDIAPGYAPAYNELGNLYRKLGETEKAGEAYEKARSVEPGWYAQFGRR